MDPPFLSIPVSVPRSSPTNPFRNSQASDPRLRNLPDLRASQASYGTSQVSSLRVSRPLLGGGGGAALRCAFNLFVGRRHPFVLVSWTNTSRGTAIADSSGVDLFVSIRVLRNAFSHVLNLVSYFGFFFCSALILLGRKQDALVFFVRIGKRCHRSMTSFVSASGLSVSFCLCFFFFFRVLCPTGTLYVGLKSDLIFLPFHGSSDMWSHVIAPSACSPTCEALSNRTGVFHSLTLLVGFV